MIAGQGPGERCRSGHYFDEDLAEAVSRLEDGLARLRRVRDAIDAAEPIHSRLAHEIARLESSLGVLAEIRDEATQELL